MAVTVDAPAGARELHGKTGHAYDEAIAIEVVAGIPDFLEEMIFLRDELRRRLA